MEIIIEVIRLLGLPGAVVLINAMMIKTIMASSDKKNHVISSHVKGTNQILLGMANDIKAMSKQMSLHAKFCEQNCRKT
jgi:hypothetical protein